MQAVLLSVDIPSLKRQNFFAPSKEEQSKIAKLLSLIDRRIATQIGLIEDLKKLKSAIRDRLYKELRQTNGYVSEIKELLNYEQPTEYLVLDTEYSFDKALTPVLTANKAFILGYTREVNNVYDKGDCIIFDDFTLDVKFVSFPFKVKSSAIKILTAKDGVDLKFMYEYFLFLNLKTEEHKRHYISEIEPMAICIPSLQEQTKIASQLSAIEKKIEVETEIKDCYAQQREYLLRQMFV